MSYKTEINILGAAPNPQRMAEALSERNLNPIIGEGVVMALKEHFLQLNEERHGRFAGNTTGFYATAADSVFYSAAEGEPSVIVPEPVGLRQRLLGGLIEPKEKNYLAIPNYEHLDVTHGKSPSEFDNLGVLFGYQDTGNIGPIALITKQGGARVADEYTKGGDFKKVKTGTGEYDKSGREKRESAGDVVLYWLKLFVLQDPDPTVVPTKDELESAGYEAAAEFLGMKIAI